MVLLPSAPARVSVSLPARTTPTASAFPALAVTATPFFPRTTTLMRTPTLLCGSLGYFTLGVISPLLVVSAGSHGRFPRRLRSREAQGNCGQLCFGHLPRHHLRALPQGPGPHPLPQRHGLRQRASLLRVGQLPDRKHSRLHHRYFPLFVVALPLTLTSLFSLSQL